MVASTSQLPSDYTPINETNINKDPNKKQVKSLGGKHVEEISDFEFSISEGLHPDIP